MISVLLVFFSVYVALVIFLLKKLSPHLAIAGALLGSKIFSFALKFLVNTAVMWIRGDSSQLKLLLSLSRFLRM